MFYKSEFLWRVMRSAYPATFLFIISISFLGCDPLKFFQPKVKVEQAVINPAAEPRNLSALSAQEKLAFHRWLVTEMREQIYARALASTADVAGWANVLAQRGSIEGVYHGLILSREYVDLENGKPASIQALRFYGTEMALMDFPAGLESDTRVQEAAVKYAKDKMRDSVFTLKRELGERLLQEAIRRKGDAEKLAAWYSGIVVRWTRLDIPFGLPQRNNKDEIFHFSWAKENTLGVIQWELLNRLHRILNQLGGISFRASGK